MFKDYFKDSFFFFTFQDLNQFVSVSSASCTTELFRTSESLNLSDFEMY